MDVLLKLPGYVITLISELVVGNLSFQPGKMPPAALPRRPCLRWTVSHIIV